MLPTHALVSIQTAEETGAHSGAMQRPTATFLAHLIAVKEHAPQTRERRRAEPHEAVAAYARTLLLDNSKS